MDTGKDDDRIARPRRPGRSPRPRGGPGRAAARAGPGTMTGGIDDEDAAPSALALRVWEVDRQHLLLRSFNAAPPEPPVWWVGRAFAEPVGGWPRDRPLVAECRADQAAHAASARVRPRLHRPRRRHPGPGLPVRHLLHSQHQGRLGLPAPGPWRRARTSGDGWPDDHGRGRAPVGYARSQYARVAAVLLIDRSLTIDHGTLRRLADGLPGTRARAA